MTKNRILYLALVILLAGVAALSGAAAGGVAVYQVMSRVETARLTLSAPVTVSVPASSTSPAQTARPGHGIDNKFNPDRYHHYGCSQENWPFSCYRGWHRPGPDDLQRHDPQWHGQR